MEPEVAAVPANRPVPRRNSTLTDEAFKKLDEQLRQRPGADELIDKGILRDSNVAPALQAATKQLERSQLEDKIAKALTQRPGVDELVRDGILQAEKAPTV